MNASMNDKFSYTYLYKNWKSSILFCNSKFMCLNRPVVQELLL
jgi:hypothetical protein